MSKFVKFDDNDNLLLINVELLNFVAITEDNYIVFNFDDKDVFTNVYESKEKLKYAIKDFFSYRLCNFYNNIVKFENEKNIFLINTNFLINVYSNFEDNDLSFNFKNSILYTKNYDDKEQVKNVLNDFHKLLISKKL